MDCNKLPKNEIDECRNQIKQKIKELSSAIIPLMANTTFAGGLTGVGSDILANRGREAMADSLNLNT